MNCEETRNLLDAYLDRELDLVTSLRVEEHLRSCPACQQAKECRRMLTEVVSRGPLRYSLPGGLESRVVAAVRLAGGGETAAGATAPPIRFPAIQWGYAGALATCMLLIGVVIGGVVVSRARITPAVALTDELISGHVRSLMATHLFDVPSTNQHTVKPWFAGKLDFAPPVVNLAEQGFPLKGGRLDYLEGRPVAALVYQRHQHWINLFVWPASGKDSSPESRAERGYTVFRWSAAGVNYAAVSDLNVAELEEFVQFLARESRVEPLTNHETAHPEGTGGGPQATTPAASPAPGASGG